MKVLGRKIEAIRVIKRFCNIYYYKTKIGVYKLTDGKGYKKTSECDTQRLVFVNAPNFCSVECFQFSTFYIV